MYVIEYEEYVFTYRIEKKEAFCSSSFDRFIKRLAEIRELGLTIISTYRID